MAAAGRRDPGEALAEAMADGDSDRIVEILMGGIWFFYNHDYATLQAAVTLLSDETLERQPVLRLLHPLGGVLARTTRPFESDDFESLVATGRQSEVGLLIMLQGIATRVSGDIAAAVRSAHRLEDWIRQHELAASSRNDGPLWAFHHQIGSTLLLAGDTVGALRELGIAKQIGIPSGSADAQRSAAARIAVVHAVRGSLGDAERSLAEALALPHPTAAYAASSYGTERTAAALISVERLAADADARVAELDSVDNFEVIWPFELLAKTRLALARHEPAEALEQVNLAAATHRVQTGSFAADLIEATNIVAALTLGDLDGADRAVGASRSRGPMTRFAAVEASVHRGDLTQAQEDLRHLSTRAALSPLQRAGVVMFTARLDAVNSGRVSPHVATELATAITQRGLRRLATELPAPVVPLLRTPLAPALARAFDEATRDLSFADPAGSISRALTDGERRVLAALASHETVAEIAAALHVSPNTVKTQLRSLYRKIGVSNRTDAIAVSSRMTSARRASG